MLPASPDRGSRIIIELLVTGTMLRGGLILIIPIFTKVAFNLQATFTKPAFFVVHVVVVLVLSHPRFAMGSRNISMVVGDIITYKADLLRCQVLGNHLWCRCRACW